MAIKIHKSGTQGFDDAIDSAARRDTYGVYASKVCSGGKAKRTKLGSTSKWTIATQFPSMVVTGAKSKTEAVSAIRKVLRPSARGAGHSCQILVDAWPLDD